MADLPREEQGAVQDGALSRDGFEPSQQSCVQPAHLALQAAAAIPLGFQSLSSLGGFL